MQSQRVAELNGEFLTDGLRKVFIHFLRLLFSYARSRKKEKVKIEK
jgi:hypothetical protein